MPMANPHLAYAAIDGQQINGYTVHITEILEDRVLGELLQEGRTRLHFTIRLDADQFKVPAVRAEILSEFAAYIQQNAMAPSGGTSRLTLLWKSD